MYKFSLMENGNFHEMARIQIEAYPSALSNATAEQYAERLAETHNRPNVNYYGAYKGDKLVGGFSIWDFELNFRQNMIKAGGVGGIAVDLGHKKEKIAREIMRFFHNHLRKNGMNMAMLYPFDSSFYKRMGYGFGTFLHQFRLKPQDLMNGDSKAHIRRLTVDDAQILADFYNTCAKSTHGFTTKSVDDFTRNLKAPANKIFAYVDNGVRGYISFQFKKGSDNSWLVTDMFVSEMLFSSPEVFMELMAFVKSQGDQVRYVIFNTQDEGLVNTVSDPRNYSENILFSCYQEVSKAGLGIMYRICDIEAFFNNTGECQFGNLDLTLQVNISDSFVPDNNRSFMLQFCGGLCKVETDVAPDVELSIDIAEFSALVVGSVNLKSLVKYGKARLSDDSYLEILSRNLSLDEKPICLTHF